MRHDAKYHTGLRMTGLGKDRYIALSLYGKKILSDQHVVFGTIIQLLSRRSQLGQGGKKASASKFFKLVVYYDMI